MPRARILHLDDSETMLALVREWFAPDDLEILSALTPSAALALAERPFDLVIADVNLPEISGFRFRDVFRAIPGREKTPFLFVTAADPQVEVEIATALGEDELLPKPFEMDDLRRAVFASLGLARTESGSLPEALDGILSSIAAAGESGVLTAMSGPMVKRVVFQDGRIAFAASNSPADLIGQAMVRSGLVSEADLVAALDAREAGNPKPRLGAAFAALRKVTPEQCETVFEVKIREAVLDIFLWPSGTVEYVAGAMEFPDGPSPIALNLQAVRNEGINRRRQWAEVQKILPDPRMGFDVVKWPAGFPADESDRSLAQYVQAGRSLGEIMVELRGQSFAVGTRLAELVRSGALKTHISKGAFASELPPRGDRTDEIVPSGAKPPAVPASQILTRALAQLRQGELEAARIGFLEVLAIDASDPLARLRLRQVEEAITAAARQAGITNELRVRLAIPVGDLAGRDITPTDAFVLTRVLENPLSVGELIGICPMTEHEVLAAVSRYLADGTLERA